MARSRGLSEAQPSVAGSLKVKHLEDAKTDAIATKIRILQMPHPGNNCLPGVTPFGLHPGYAPQLRFGFASFRSRCDLSKEHRFSQNTSQSHTD